MVAHSSTQHCRNGDDSHEFKVRQDCIVRHYTLYLNICKRKDLKICPFFAVDNYGDNYEIFISF